LKYIEVSFPEGKIEYSFRVLVKLIEKIILQISGVDSLEKVPEESIKIETKKEFLNISLFVRFTLEKRVPEIAWDLQKILKDQFETKSGLKIDRIDIYVQGFSSIGLNENFDNLFFPTTPELSMQNAP
jgi:uncharacterized alkaline shock family protein YloU